MINQAIIYFIFTGFLGYIYETFAMTIWSSKFENRGFLLGPIIPIYGLGAVIATLLFEHYFKGLSNVLIFFISVIGSAILEYPTHYFMEKLFHQRWWDYSKAPLNINGRICLPAALGFGVAALVIVRVINPFIIPIIMKMSDSLTNGLSLIFTGLFCADLATTIAIVSDFEEKIANGEDIIDEKIQNVLGKYLNEDKKLSDKFYHAVDVVSDSKVSKVPKKAAKKVKTGAKLFYSMTIQRVIKYVSHRRNSYNMNGDQDE